jgi:catechol 2,3-dioxygenase-like lactoylglutathione lyase family enzyme
MSLSNYKLRTSVAVSDMVNAKEFYEDKLGLSVVQTGADGGNVYESAGEEALEVYPSPDTAGGSMATLATWHVNDVERIADELIANGVVFEQYEGKLESGFDYSTNEKGISPRAGGGKVAWFKDPDGNIFSIEGDR